MAGEPPTRKRSLEEEFDELVRKSAEDYKRLGEKNAAIHYRAAAACLPEFEEVEGINEFEFFITTTLAGLPPAFDA